MLIRFEGHYEGVEGFGLIFNDENAHRKSLTNLLKEG
jgi:hypothetical protein